MRFDYYSATKPASPGPLVEWLSDASRGLRRRDFRPRHGYGVGIGFDAPDGSTASVCFGGKQEDAWVEGTGPLAAELAAVIRTEWPEHKVTRADVCEDMRGTGLFDQLGEQCKAVAVAHRVKVTRYDSAGTDDQAGRTWYYGAATSAVRVRVYEKGKQLMEQMTASDRGLLARSLRDLVRFEVVVRPDGDARWECAQRPPEHFLGASEWVQTMAKEILQLDVERLTITAGYRPPDHVRAMNAVIRQYGKQLSAYCAIECGGDWAKLGGDISRRISEEAASAGGGSEQLRTLLAAIRSSAGPTTTRH